MKYKPDMEYLREYVDDICVTYICRDGTKIKSTVISLDVNDHISELDDTLQNIDADKTQRGTFDVYYKGKRMFIGDGPRYSTDSIKIISKYDAEIGQDIYCMCKR